MPLDGTTSVLALIENAVNVGEAWNAVLPPCAGGAPSSQPALHVAFGQNSVVRTPSVVKAAAERPAAVAHGPACQGYRRLSRAPCLWLWRVANAWWRVAHA